MPFIEILKDRNIVVSLDPGVDYRRKALAGSEKVYFDLSDPKSGGDKAMDGMFKFLASKETSLVRPMTIR